MTNFLDITHRLSELKPDVSQSGICLRHQVKNTSTLFSQIDVVSLYLPDTGLSWQMFLLFLPVPPSDSQDSTLN
jgi:hypothetical protein